MDKLFVNMLSLFGFKSKNKKPSIIKRFMDNPEDFYIEGFIEKEEIVIKIKKRKLNQ